MLIIDSRNHQLCVTRSEDFSFFENWLERVGARFDFFGISFVKVGFIYTSENIFPPNAMKGETFNNFFKVRFQKAKIVFSFNAVF